MPTNISVPQSSSDSRNNESSLLNDTIENRVKNEKKLIDEINAKFNKKREEVLKKFDIKEASNYLKKERETFDSFFGQLGENVARLEPIKKALRKEIQKKALKKFPVFRELALINAENATSLQNGLPASAVLDGHLHPPLSDPEIFLPVENPYQEIVPPFNLTFTHKVGGENRFNHDYSFPMADVAVLQNNVNYKDSNGTFDYGSSNKTAVSDVGIGCSYTMPKDGMLDVIVVLMCGDNLIGYSVRDNFGPSDAWFRISNVFTISLQWTEYFVPVAANLMIEVYDHSGGDDISKTITAFPYGRTFTLNFPSIGGRPVRSGDTVAIKISSAFIAHSALHNMDLDITASALWQVQHLYVRVR